MGSGDGGDNPFKVGGKAHLTDENRAEFRARTAHIQDEFGAALNDLAGTHAFSLSGLALAREKYQPLVDNAPDPERYLIWVNGSPKDLGNFGYMRWQIKTIPERLAADGPLAQRLGQQWAVLVHTQWEHAFRPRLAKEVGLERNDIKEPIFADIGRMRNDIVHHHGIATKKNCGKCEVLKWFQPGDRILITSNHVSNFMRSIGAITEFSDTAESVPVPGLEDWWNPDGKPKT